MRRKWIITVLLLGVSISSFSQGTIKGKLIDSIAKQPMSLATITVFRAKDTSIVTYRLSDPQGNFKVPGLPFNIPLRTVITSSGYKVIRRSFTLTAENAQLDFGIISGYTDTTSLEEFLVIAERPPVTIRKDTIEFNAAAFKTLPSALVEDLLKKFPGVEVAADGSIKVNGRAVNRILVDGRDFFGGDPLIATRNLPANLIDKVQVTDDKEELAKNPEANKNEIGQVINLKLKKSIKKGWFGKAYAGAGKGSIGHYEAGTIVNTFRDTLQVSVLAYTNNVNRSGFGYSDLQQIGGFDRSGVNGMSEWSSGGLEINGISFGGTGTGIQKSTGAGFNINHDPSQKVKLNFQYFYSHVNSNFISNSIGKQFFNDTILTTSNKTNENGDVFSHGLSVKLRWNIDTITSIDIRPSIKLVNRKSNKDFYSESSSNFDSLLNNSFNTESRNAVEKEYAVEMNLNRGFKQGKGYLNSLNNFRFNSALNEFQNDVLSTFFKPGTQVSKLNQIRNQDKGNLYFRSYLAIGRYFNKSFTYSASNTLTLYRDKDEIRTADLNPITGLYDLPNPNLSNGLLRKGITNFASMGLGWRNKKFSVRPGIQWQYIGIENNYEKGLPIRQEYNFLFPTFSIYWNTFYFSYQVGAQPPSANDLSPVVNNTNPLYQYLGNPDLKPSKGHNTSMGYNRYYTKQQLYYNLNANYRYSENTVIRARSVTSNGIQVSKPVNIDNTYSYYLNGNIGKQYKFSGKWKINIGPDFNYSVNNSYVIVNGNKSKVAQNYYGGGINLSFNWDDKLELSQSYRVNKSSTKYENSAFKDLQVTTHYANSMVVVRTKKNLVLESSFDYRYNPQVSPSLRRSIYKWDAAINYLFLKDQKGQLKFIIFDILKQNVNSYRTVSENAIQDITSNSITRYFMLTFTYSIREFKSGGKKSMLLF